MVKKLMLFCSVLLLCNSAIAEETSSSVAMYPGLADVLDGYTVIDRSALGDLVHIKLSSIKPYEDKIRVWIIQEFGPRTRDGLPPGSVAMRVKLEADCDGESLTMIEAQVINSYGTTTKVVTDLSSRLPVNSSDGYSCKIFRRICSQSNSNSPR